MKERQSGFLLITVVLMISVLTMLGTAHLKSVLLYLKRHHQYHDYLQRRVQLENVGQQLIKYINWRKVKPDAVYFLPDRMTHQLLLERGHVFDTHYRYVIGDLGEYACVKLSGSKKLSSSHHWLLTLMDEHYSTRMLQLRIAIKIPEQVCDLETVSLYHQGVMSWRLVTILVA